jgi:nucleoside phosphorylase
MAGNSQSFDVCIVCALYEEARAVLDEIAARCTVSFAQGFTGFDSYEYWYTTIQNNKGEPLTLFVTWLADSGPVRTSLDLKPLLQEFRPRFAAMTGFCSGYKEKVRLGDLVVAQYAYHYEERKIRVGLDGQAQNIPEMKTYGTTTQVIHYARGFEGWREPVTELKRSKLRRQEMKDAERPKCYIAPMASGMAVREDNPFPWLTEYRNRKTIALDMEAAALTARPSLSTWKQLLFISRSKGFLVFTLWSSKECVTMLI